MNELSFLNGRFIGMNKILQGDCSDVLKTLPSDSVDYIIFSPPYDSIRKYKGFSPFDKTKREAICKELLRVAKDGAACSVIIQDQTVDGAKTGTSMRVAVEWMDLGWNLFETTIYKRHGPPGVFWKRRFRVDHEYVHTFFKGDKVKHFNKDHMLIPSKHAGKIVSCDKRHAGGETEEGKDFLCPDMKCLGTVWEYASSNREGNKVKMQHPATFPDKLAGDLIRCFTVEQDLVLDCMAGSGTSCVMAKKYKRNYIGIEFSEEYVEIIKSRFENEISDDVFE